MKKKRISSFLMVLFLTAGFVQTPVHAETDNIQVESVTLTDDNRYNPEYYREPEVYYPAAKKAMSRTARAQQTLEEYVVAALENFQETIDVSAYNIPLETADEEYFKILNNNPQLFYVAGKYSGSFYQGASTILSYKVTYLYDRDTATQMLGELKTAAEQVASQVDRSMPDYQQALIVHDYLVQNCEYDYENYLKEPVGRQVPDISHTAYGSLVNGMAVCDGYADGFAYIMEDMLEISCDVVSSDAMAHAWNMIEIGGKWYHVDATWDDPTWDCIGRVGHNNFLLSDSKISNNSPNAQSGKNHYSWNKLHTAESTGYDNAFWADVKSAICYYNGAWYYSKYQDVGNSPTAEIIATAVKLVKKDGAQLLTGSENVVHSTSVWFAQPAGYYPGCYMYLAQGNNRLYFNTSTEIYQVNADGSVGKLYSPQNLSDMQIYGFTVRGKEFWYAPQSTPSSSQKQTDIRKYILQEISGISAADVTRTYNGQPYTIEVIGTQEGDVVQYAGEDGNYQLNQPRMVDAGTYEVRYRVERDGYAAFYGTAAVTIQQAEPQYEVPTGLKGRIGDTLASVTLPERFSWQTPADTRLEGLGTKKYKVKYVPADAKNYRTVSDIEVSVEQECPGHQYTSQITTPPTEEQNGVETYTCTICGDTYTQEIDKDLPALTDVSAENVTGAYTGEKYTITITGVQEGDTVQYAIEDGAYEEVQPEMKNAGVYHVLYKVERANYRPFYGSARVEITKAVPSYTLPANCAGNSGDRLENVSLPKGFAWKAPGTALREEGPQTYPAIYTPEDTVNYQVVTVQITLTVTCPGHSYSSVVTKQPTESEEGIRTYTCTICGHSYSESIDKLLPVITGITADNVTGVYNGQSYTIEVKGTIDGDVVQYALKSDTDAQYTAAQPEMKRSGTYQVLYKVTRTGCQPFIGSARVEITRAVPQYTVPANLKGKSGDALSSVTLPQGFIWQTAPDTKLGKEGYNKFYACYRPSDQVNYSIVTNIEIVIEVKCPGHQYGLVITARPTETKKGLKTYTCRLCEKSYTEEIPMLAPTRPAMVSGLKVAKQTDTSLSFSWKQVPGVRFRLMLYQGNEVISTKYVTGNNCKYTKLKPATVYTLRVTPYRIVNGQNIYAISTGSAKTVTTPAKAKLSKAKRSGKSKVKLTWKKVSGASGYEISMKKGNGKYKKIKMVGKKVSFTKTGLNKKTSYSFRIRAYVTVDGKKIYGTYSNVKKVK